MNQLQQIVQELEIHIIKCEISNPAVSSSTVGWQIEHCLLTINRIVDAILNSNPKDYKWKFSLSKFIVFTLSKIPRGRAKASKVVQPKTYDMESLQKHVLIVKEKIILFDKMSRYQFFEHPYFGKLKKKDAIQFLCIHTKHHLNIIRDIVKQE
jgi:hypothetical protein